MQGIDLFSGAGGMSIGASFSGIQVTHAFEKDIHAANTYKKNHKTTQVFCCDIQDVDNFTQYRDPNRECVVFGGPPCQGFSTSNQRTRGIKNPNNWLFQQFLRAVQQITPEWVVFENVRGILETEQAHFLDFVIDGLESLGYRTDYAVLNSVNYGVPQKRSRLFVIAFLPCASFRFPDSTVSHPVTVAEAISDLPILQNGATINICPYSGPPLNKYAKSMRGRKKLSANHLVTKNADYIIQRYRHIPQGGNWEDIPEKLLSNYKDATRCHTGIYRRLSETSPSVVIGNYRKNMLIHPTANRGLSVREAARLQSFPDWFTFTGSIGFQQQQVGNAVPPLLAKAVFEQINININLAPNAVAAE